MDLLETIATWLCEDEFNNLFEQIDYEMFCNNGSDIVWLLSILESHELVNLYNWYIDYKDISYEEFQQQINFYIWLVECTGRTHIQSWFGSLPLSRQQDFEAQYNKIVS